VELKKKWVTSGESRPVQNSSLIISWARN
jgi:hypothetical protein